MNWYSALDVSLRVSFTLPNGERLLRVVDDILPAHLKLRWYMTWQFHPMNPWLERFDRCYHSAVDSGLMAGLIRRST